MGRSSSTFRQTDITRALKAVRAAGCSAVRVQIDKVGWIEIATQMEGEPSGSGNSWGEAPADAADQKRPA
jgi:hypothetical protein